MFKKRKPSHPVISGLGMILLIFSCGNNHKGNFEVIKYHQSAGKWPCYLKFENNKYDVVDYKRKYKNGKLMEYEGCASEGLYTTYFKNRKSYATEDKRVQYLSIWRTLNQVVFFDKVYPILKENKDSLFVNTEVEGEYYVFIGKIPIEK